jgi:tetratricopeptide (TPR) repeat protein
MKTVTALEVNLAEGEQAHMIARGTTNLEAYLKILQSTDYRRRLNVEDNLKARRLAEEAISLDPDYAMAYSALARTHIVDVWLRNTKSRQESFGIAIDLAKKALSLDESLADAHDVLGNILILKKDYENGIAQLESALEFEPNGADIHAHLGLALYLADRSQEAVQVLQKAIRLNPNPPSWYLHNLAAAYNFIENYQEAIIWGEKAVQLNPKSLLGHVVLCSIYSSAGRMEEARKEASEILKINPKYSVSQAEKTNPIKNQAVKKRYFDALRKAGLPD